MRLPRFVVRATTAFAVMAVTTSTVQASAADPAAEPGGGPAVQKARSVPGHPVVVNPLPPNDMLRSSAAPPPVHWPAAARSEVDLPVPAGRGDAIRHQQAGALPVRVGPAGAADASAESPKTAAKVAVETYDQDTARKVGLAGTLLRVADAGGATGRRLSVQLDYTGFGQAYGGDYGSRLHLAEYPACVLTTPERPECRAGKPLPSSNHALNRTVSAEITLPAEKSGAGTVLAAQAADSGSGGTYAATDLAPSGSWSAGSSSGDFTYSVPLTLPPAPGGPAPELAFDYSSGSVDGRTSATNSQASWVGDGWDISSGGFLERIYTGCAEDKGGNQGTQPTGDLCWKGERYVVSIGGISGKLIRDRTNPNLLRPEQDDGSKIEKLADAATNNGDDNGEHWKVTAPDGTQYFLGLNRLPGWVANRPDMPETNSVLTVPVYGNHTGEPCNKSTFAASACRQAYRWNVDLVVDPRGNAMTFYYDKEFNRYKRGGLQGVNDDYVAAGRLASIQYGLRSDAPYALAPARVLFQPADRCAANDPTCDVPFDRICNANQDCTGRYSPTFFTRSRLSRVVTQSLVDGTHRDVDSWTLRHQLPPTGDGQPRSLWLDGITRTGHVGGTASLPEIQFVGRALENRLDGLEGYLPITRYRLTRIIGSAGSVTEITYTEAECVRSSLPAAHANTKRCYPSFWGPPDATEPVQDWFNKFVVASVSEDSRTGGPSISKTSYQYFEGGSASTLWSYDDNAESEAKYRTWSGWRGYGKVRTIQGDAAEPQTVTETVTLRGLDGDVLPGGAVRTVELVDDGGRIKDRPELAGFVRESLTLSGGRVVSAEITEPHVIQTASDGTDTANIVGTKSVASRTLQENGTWRRTKSTTTEFTAEGLAAKEDDEGDTAVTGDESCTQTTYRRNDAKWMLSYAAQVRTIAKPCGVWPGTADDVESDVLSAYDNQAADAAPTRGVVTETKRWTGGSTYQKISSEKTDAYGRVTESTDVEGKKTTTVYTPATGNPTTVETTNRVGWTTKSIMDPARGLALAEIGVNGERTDLEYDPLGRLIKVWIPGWSKAQHPTKPTTEYSYEYRRDAATVVTTKTLREDQTYAVSYDLYDGLLRLRQSQTPAMNGGRIITDSFHNSRGQEFKTNGGYYNLDAPAKELLGVYDWDVSNQTVNEYDDLGRPIEMILKRQNAELSRTKIRYAGDTTYTTPPVGDTPTAVFKDAHGRIVERRQYHTPSASGFYAANAPADVMTYKYNAKGDVDRVTDAQGNQWRYEYDQLGRKKADVDPDRGRTTYNYNAVDQLESTKDAREQTLTHTYDDLGRPKAMYAGPVSTGTKLAEWTYDTLRKGTLTSTKRFVNGHTYEQKVDQYDDVNRPTLVSVIIPQVEGALAGTYTYGASFSPVTGQLKSEILPAAGGLPAETVIHDYNDLGQPTKTYGLNTYAQEHLYSPYGETLRVTFGDSPNKVWVKSDYTEGTRRMETFEVYRDKTIQAEVSKRRFDYDQAGNITKISDRPTDGPADTQCFGYDHVRRMTSAWTPASHDCKAPKSVANLGGAAPYWLDYTFDAIGNRKTQVKHTAAGDVTETYTVPLSGADKVRPHAVDAVTKTGPAGTSRDEFTYDPAGNVRTRNVGGNTQTLDWGPDGKLAAVTEADGKKSQYLYDADGNRLLKKEPDATTLYLPGQELVLNAGAAQPSGKRYYSHGGGTVAVRTSAGALSYMLSDHHGTDEVAITASNLFVTRRYHDPFGADRGTQPSAWPDDKGFVGGIEDDTGLVAVGAREYDPATGRFASVDPVVDFADPQQTHGYAYANNAPATYSDPTGMYHMVDQEGKYRAGPRGAGWTPAKEQKMRKYYKGRARVKKVVNNSKKRACKSMKMSEKSCKKMQSDANSKKGFWDIMKEELPDLIGDLTGFNDLKNCFTKGDLMACAGILPWGRIFKLAKNAGKILSAVRKALKWEDRVRDARRMMKTFDARVNTFTRQGMNDLKKTADNASAGKAPDKPATSSSGGHGCHSFPPGTRVLLADGSTRPIEQVKLGDTVRTTDPATGRTQARKVVATWVHDNEPQRTEVTLDTDGPAGTATATLTATDWHPVWAADLKAWVPIGNLKAGSWLQTSAGTWVQATAVRHYTGTGKVHDLTIDGIHAYHVVAGGVATLVHNCGDGGGSGGSPAPSPGKATVNWDGHHASIETEVNGNVVHTHRLGGLVGDVGTPTMPVGWTGTVPANARRVEVDLPNGAGAQKYQTETIGDNQGTYNIDTNSCLTYCADVIREGGADVPKGITSNDFGRWLLRHGRKLK